VLVVHVGLSAWLRLGEYARNEIIAVLRESVDFHV